MVFLHVCLPGLPFTEGELEEVEAGCVSGDLEAVADREPPIGERVEDRRAGVGAVFGCVDQGGGDSLLGRPCALVVS